MHCTGCKFCERGAIAVNPETWTGHGSIPLQPDNPTTRGGGWVWPGSKVLCRVRAVA